MGPRFSRTRKRKGTLRVRLTAPSLQWGRVLTNAETTYGRSIRLQNKRASMGPRSHERGNGSTGLFFPSEHFDASMGPRSHERGNNGRRSVSTGVLYSFNGAAFSRTRKLFRLSPSFVIETALQWGRVLTNAETVCSADPSRIRSGLQWGRVLTNAETRRRGSFEPVDSASFNGAAFSRTRKLRLGTTTQ